MRIPSSEHLTLDLRVHELLPDFRLEDVWRLPEVVGTAEEFDDAIAMTLTAEPGRGGNVPSRFLWWARDALGRWFGLGEVHDADPSGGLAIPGDTASSIVPRLPADLRGTVDGMRHEHLPFTPVYRTATEYAAEISNRTVHGVLHLAWVERPDGLFQGQMAVYVKPRGRFGHAYMAFIKPFRYLVVYPAMERQVARDWASRVSRGPRPRAS
ncbi:DUF2867 domain-containing protein [Nocardioides panacisoli]|uniref:DUF2867 domain-containing protein n=1 Tax=Nocardioides panacisoli TaxID=627624 RepID=A0ABP7IJY2_9ACTN